MLRPAACPQHAVLLPHAANSPAIWAPFTRFTMTGTSCWELSSARCPVPESHVDGVQRDDSAGVRRTPDNADPAN